MVMGGIADVYHGKDGSIRARVAIKCTIYIY